ncbi:MAG: hypothetical protein AAFY88_06285, partial [Acidobacteriota bacterium]
GAGAATVEVVGGQLVYTQTGTARSLATLVWDQADGDFGVVDADGLRALDLTAGGTRDALAVEVASAGAGARLVFDVISGSGTSSFALELPSGAAGETFVLPFEDFAGDADLTRAGALRLVIDHSSAPGVDVTVDRIATVSRVVARQTVIDLNGGDLVPGDVLEVVVDIENPADGVGAAATGVAFSEGLVGGTAIVCDGAGAPVVSQGTITGCVESSDSSSSAEGAGGTLDVSLGTLADGAVATLTFQTVVQSSAPAEVCNGGRLASSTLSGVLSDDPSTASSLDVTCASTAPPAQVEIAHTLEVIDDRDGSQNTTPGDRVRVTSTVEHVGGVRDATGLTLATAGFGVDIVPGSIVSSQGVVTAGNAGGEELGVSLGSLAAGAQATVTFEADLLALSFDRSSYEFESTAVGEGVWDYGRLPVILNDDNREFFLPRFETLMRDVLLVDADGDGLASPGDTLRYEVEITNRGGRLGLNSVFETEGFSNITLVPGSVVIGEAITAPGAIGEAGEAGGAVGAGSAGRAGGAGGVRASLGEIDGLGVETVVLHFDVTIDDPLPPGVAGVSLAAETVATAIRPQPSDDPDTPEPEDATVTPVPRLIFGDGFESGDTGAWSALIQQP